MNKILATAQQRIGMMIGLIGLIRVIINIIGLYMHDDSSIITIFTSLNVWLLFITLIPFFISVFIENKILKIIQVALFIFTGVMNIMDSYNEIYGPGMFFAAWLLGRHYGFFEKYMKIKYTLFFLLLIILTQISAFVHNQGSFDAGTGILVYTAFIVFLVIIIWRDMLYEQKKLKIENKSLKINYKTIRDQLMELEEEQKPFNLKAMKITPAEERIIKTLTIYRASNREIAERLNIAESTVKLHLYNIYNKIGVDNRFAIIDLCKYNYT